jgi:hypothetical protein
MSSRRRSCCTPPRQPPSTCRAAAAAPADPDRHPDGGRRAHRRQPGPRSPAARSPGGGGADQAGDPPTRGLTASVALSGGSLSRRPLPTGADRRPPWLPRRPLGAGSPLVGGPPYHAERPSGHVRLHVGGGGAEGPLSEDPRRWIAAPPALRVTHMRQQARSQRPQLLTTASCPTSPAHPFAHPVAPCARPPAGATAPTPRA